MTDAELLRHYIVRERVIFCSERSPGHYRLRQLGFIEEHSASHKNLLITVTSAGRAALEPQPAA